MTMSTSDSKKKSSSIEHLIKEHHDEETNDSNKQKKTVDDILIEEVHTANNWENADLGNDQRKQKFLRLMGVKKRKDESRTDTKDSHGDTSDDASSSEKKHCRSKVENETIDRELEKQFNGGLQSKILHTHHEGLGFHGNESNTASSSNDCHHQQVKTKFVLAIAETKSSSLNNTVSKESEKVEGKSNDQQLKTNKSTT